MDLLVAAASSAPPADFVPSRKEQLISTVDPARQKCGADSVQHALVTEKRCKRRAQAEAPACLSLPNDSGFAKDHALLFPPVLQAAKRREGETVSIRDKVVSPRVSKEVSAVVHTLLGTDEKPSVPHNSWHLAEVGKVRLHTRNAWIEGPTHNPLVSLLTLMGSCYVLRQLSVAEALRLRSTCRALRDAVDKDFDQGLVTKLQETRRILWGMPASAALKAPAGDPAKLRLFVAVSLDAGHLQPISARVKRRERGQHIDLYGLKSVLANAKAGEVPPKAVVQAFSLYRPSPGGLLLVVHLTSYGSEETAPAGTPEASEPGSEMQDNLLMRPTKKPRCLSSAEVATDAAVPPVASVVRPRHPSTPGFGPILAQAPTRKQGHVLQRTSQQYGLPARVTKALMGDAQVLVSQPRTCWSVEAGIIRCSDNSDSGLRKFAPSAGSSAGLVPASSSQGGPVAGPGEAGSSRVAPALWQPKLLVGVSVDGQPVIPVDAKVARYVTDTKVIFQKLRTALTEATGNDSILGSVVVYGSTLYKPDPDWLLLVVDLGTRQKQAAVEDGEHSASPPSAVQGEHSALLPSAVQGEHPASPPSAVQGEHSASPPSAVQGEHPASPPSAVQGEHPASSPSAVQGEHPASPPSAVQGEHPASPPSAVQGEHPASPPSAVQGEQGTAPPPPEPLVLQQDGLQQPCLAVAEPGSTHGKAATGQRQQGMSEAERSPAMDGAGGATPPAGGSQEGGAAAGGTGGSGGTIGQAEGPEAAGMPSPPRIKIKLRRPAGVLAAAERIDAASIPANASTPQQLLASLEPLLEPSAARSSGGSGSTAAACNGIATDGPETGGSGLGEERQAPHACSRRDQERDPDNSFQLKLVAFERNKKRPFDNTFIIPMRPFDELAVCWDVAPAAAFNLTFITDMWQNGAVEEFGLELKRARDLRKKTLFVGVAASDSAGKHLALSPADVHLEQVRCRVGGAKAKPQLAATIMPQSMFGETQRASAMSSYDSFLYMSEDEKTIFFLVRLRKSPQFCPQQAGIAPQDPLVKAPVVRVSFAIPPLALADSIRANAGSQVAHVASKPASLPGGARPAAVDVLEDDEVSVPALTTAPTTASRPSVVSSVLDRVLRSFPAAPEADAARLQAFQPLLRLAAEAVAAADKGFFGGHLADADQPAQPFLEPQKDTVPGPASSGGLDALSPNSSGGYSPVYSTSGDTGAREAEDRRPDASLIQAGRGLGLAGSSFRGAGTGAAAAAPTPLDPHPGQLTPAGVPVAPIRASAASTVPTDGCTTMPAPATAPPVVAPVCSAGAAATSAGRPVFRLRHSASSALPLGRPAASTAPGEHATEGGTTTSQANHRPPTASRPSVPPPIPVNPAVSRCTAALLQHAAASPGASGFLPAANAGPSEPELHPKQQLGAGPNAEAPAAAASALLRVQEQAVGGPKEKQSSCGGVQKRKAASPPVCELDSSASDDDVGVESGDDGEVGARSGSQPSMVVACLLKGMERLERKNAQMRRLLAAKKSEAAAHESAGLAARLAADEAMARALAAEEARMRLLASLEETRAKLEEELQRERLARQQAEAALQAQTAQANEAQREVERLRLELEQERTESTEARNLLAQFQAFTQKYTPKGT
ncbi:hypothetical protein Agub_g5498 [Astrephomene gubernaculifera]|uniref:Uncharacterized protein n=1 Tax=Astrephomene gubernaculifera TaxID=47775 RepID=A0AAD3DND7_9CHLO|nr:hypothetical protein Agub_g5498 [Astrephomene gubernaculifera]